VTRVIAGAARGRRLAVPPGRLTRPTSDRAREGLFSTLTAIRGPLAGARVLDLYAGSGAVGLEALSRGAARVLFVEADPGAARVIRGNLAAVGLPGGHLVTGRVERVLARGPDGEPGYDLVVADPPSRRCWRRCGTGPGLLLGRLSPWSGPAGQSRCAGRRGMHLTGPVGMARRPSGTVSPQVTRRRMGCEGGECCDERACPRASCRLPGLVRSGDQRPP